MDHDSGAFYAGWNLAEPMLFDIGNRLKTGRDNLLAGNLEKYFWNMETIGRIIYGFLTEEERKQLMDKEMEITSMFPITKEKYPQLSILLKKYDGFIMILLHSHKLLVPPKKDKTRLIA